MTNTACEKCKPDRPETHESAISNSLNNSCTIEYDLVQKCMKEYNGNISNCQEVWSAFKSCHQIKSDERKAINKDSS